MQSDGGTASSAATAAANGAAAEAKYKGVRRRRWGKWVSEIRVPESRERLWLGSYSNPEAAAVAHDTAVFYLRGPGPASAYNFPEHVRSFAWAGMSPRSVQKVASDNGMAVDAELAIRRINDQRGAELEAAPATKAAEVESCGWEWGNEWQDVSFDDVDFYM